jgi:hypothetical protein
MLAEILALLVVAAAPALGQAATPAAPPHAVSGLTVPAPGKPPRPDATLASKMRMNLWSADGAPVGGGVVHIPIRLNLKGAAN